MQKYSQAQGLWAITKASLLVILKNPSSIFFSLLFPLVFVWIFGSFGGGTTVFKVAINANTDTSNLIYQQLKFIPLIKLTSYTNEIEQKTDLEKGRLSAVLTITKKETNQYNLHLNYTSANTIDVAQLKPILENIAYSYQKSFSPNYTPLVTITENSYSIRAYKSIDFVLPGQIGFSILFSTLFGIAFTFYTFREQLILKRFYASPINKLNILIGIGFSRLVFQLFNVIALIIIGKLALGFTLANGFSTFIQIIALSLLLLFVLMGVGLIFSSIVKQDSTIPLLINLFALPQMLLSGTFFSISIFPSWMQFLCKFLPLTHFNLAIRKLSFEGLSLIDCWQHIGVLGIWLIIIYALVYKYFRWE